MIAQAGNAAVPHLEVNGDFVKDTGRLADIIWYLVDKLLSWFSLGDDSRMVSAIYVLVVVAVSVGIGWVVRWLVDLICAVVLRHTRNDIYQNLYKSRFFPRLCNLVAPIMFYVMMQLTLNTMHSLTIWLGRFTLIYITILVGVSVCRLIDAVWLHVNAQQNTRRLPLRGLVQLIEGIVLIVVVIIDVSILVDKSPASLLAGLGAFAAVLMLVFKDSILGVVAGVQLSGNDALHVGDWIKVPGTDANGIVQEVSLTSIKVQNFDKTTTTLPPYSLISGSFTNYRTMQQSNTRRIMRSWMIDADSIVPIDDKLRAQISSVPLMADYFTGESTPAKSYLTNLGAFRAYIEKYLAASKYISADDLVFVTTLAQTATGVPLQLYCFTNTSNWVDYEHIQAEIFEHLATVMGRFNLYTFEDESGRDTIVDGYIGNGKSPDGVLGIPYPFFLGSDTPDNPGQSPTK